MAVGRADLAADRRGGTGELRWLRKKCLVTHPIRRGETRFGIDEIHRETAGSTPKNIGTQHWSNSHEKCLLQTGARKERIPPDTGDTVRYRDAGQTGTAPERLVSNPGDAVGNRDAGQAGAVSERIVSDAGNAVGDRDADQAVTGRKRLASNAGEAVRECDARKAPTEKERLASNAGDTAWYRDTV